VRQFVVGLGTQHLALLLVGAAGFEPTASRSQSERSAKLSYAPNKRLEVYPSLATAVKRGRNLTPPSPSMTQMAYLRP
jgi:hypothetical protein